MKFDPYFEYSNQKSLRIEIEKSITQKNFDIILNEYFDKSIEYQYIDIDLSKIEWVSIFEILLLIQWINILSMRGANIRVFFPYPASLPGIDAEIYDTDAARTILSPMYRRQRVNSFLFRMGIADEIKRITNIYPITYDNLEDNYNSITIDDDNDPFDAKLLKVSSFKNTNEIKAEDDLSNKKLRELLAKYSCLDPVDSGILSEVVIEELTSNAVTHGINISKNSIDSKRTAWVSARIVKSTYKNVFEVHKWLIPVYKRLLGKHYVELAVCDTGIGIYQTLKDHVPYWLFKESNSIKAVLDYAFDKFSSSGSKFRSEMDSMPRGLFSVYEIVRQYGGLLLVRSGGFYMGYDFLTDRKDCRLFDLYDNSGKCKDILDPVTNMGGTAIQIILPESKKTLLNKVPKNYIKPITEDPLYFNVDIDNYEEISSDEQVKSIAIDLEKFCHGNENLPILVDFTSLDTTNPNDMFLMLKLLRYILFFENPNLLFVLGPDDCPELRIANSILVNENIPSAFTGILESHKIKEVFEGVKHYDIKICPILFPNGELLWFGTSSTESNVIKSIWNGAEIELVDFENYNIDILKLAKSNNHLLSLKTGFGKSKPTIIYMRYGYFDFQKAIAKILSDVSFVEIHETENVLHTEGCYHLPHGEYSYKYIYLKPLFSKQNVVRRMARHLLLKLYINRPIGNIDIVVGGTHSAKRLILSIANQLNAETLTIDRYVEQLNEPSIENIVKGKRVLVVSDVISSGSFIKNIVMKLYSYDSNVEGVCALVDLRDKSSDHLTEINVNPISLAKYPIEKIREPDKFPIFEINQVSLRPMNLLDERKKTEINFLINTNELLDLIDKTNSIIPAHIILGPTHYTYFVDTKTLLENYAEYFSDKILEDLEKKISQYNRKNKLNLSLEDCKFIVTAEGSNAELFLPQAFLKRLPQINWIQIDRIRLSKEGMWQLDRFSPSNLFCDQFNGKIIIILDDGSNTGSTITQLLERFSNFRPKMLFAYVLVNRLLPERSLFLKRLTSLGFCNYVDINYVANFPISTFIASNCPICNLENGENIPIAEISDYWRQENKTNEPVNWNHISAKRIKDLSYDMLKNRGINSIDNFLKLVFKIRSTLGIFENRIGILIDERKQLYKYYQDINSIEALCYVFNREPQLLDSIVKFQLPSFESEFIDSIFAYIEKNEIDNSSFSNELLKFIVTKRPDLVCEKIVTVCDKIIKNEKSIIELIARITMKRTHAEIIELLALLLEKTEILPATFPLKSYLRGLSSQALAYFHIERDKNINLEIQSAINELKNFYHIGDSEHEGYKEYSSPINRIISYIHYYLRFKFILETVTVNTLYRDWRDFTHSVLIEKIIPAISSSKGILGIELESAQVRNYFLATQKGYIHDYLEIDRFIHSLKKAEKPIEYLIEYDGERIINCASRLYSNIFDPKESPIARIVKKVPVYIHKHLKERILTELAWTNEYGIIFTIDMPKTEVLGFMSMRLFNKIIKQILENIKKHNFVLSSYNNEYSKGRIQIKVINDSENDIVICIKSNGANLYTGIVGNGIMTINRICTEFHAVYDIRNDGDWVENILTIKRW